MSRELDRAVKALKAGNKAQARKMLSAILKKDKQNEMAWLWMSQTMSEREKKKQCFERVLAINPNNEHAQRAMAKLEGRRPPPPKKKQPTNPYLVETDEKKAKAKVIGVVSFLLAGLFFVGGLVAFGFGIADMQAFTLESASAEIVSWEVVATETRATLNVEYTYEVEGQMFERTQRVRAADEAEANALAAEYGIDSFLPLPPQVYYEAGSPETAEFQSIEAGRFDNMFTGGILMFVALICVWMGLALKGKNNTAEAVVQKPVATAAAAS